MSQTPLEKTQKVRDVSVTERAQFRNCRRAWELQTLENLTPRVPPDFDLEFGTGIHEALEAYYIRKSNLPLLPDTKEQRRTPLEYALNAWDRWYDATVERVNENQESFPTDTIMLLQDQLLELGDLGEEMLRGYHQYAVPLDEFTVHAVEGMQTAPGKSWLSKHFEEREFFSELASVNGVKMEGRRFLVPILDPKKQVPLKGKPMMSARIDLIVHRIDPGMKGIWIYDHKTTAYAPNDRGMDFDDQVTAYCYAVWRWLGIVPRGVVFNFLVKQAPKDPRSLKSGDLSSAKSQLTTPQKYRRALRDRGLMLKDGTIKDKKYEEAYEALLSRGWSPFFVRHEVTRNRSELKHFEERLADEWEEMHDCYMGDMPLLPNLSRWTCPRCRVAPICQAIEDGSDVEGIIESRYMDAGDRKAVFEVA